MPQSSHTIFHQKISAAGLLIAMGIVFGDIGTSPLYTYTAIFHEGEIINATKAMGVLSAVFWTLLLLTSVKYIFIVLKADNKGEGGIFSLFALVRRHYGKWLVVPAIIGAAFLMADGIITPPISVASAIEGLEKFKPGLDTVPWVIIVLVILFFFQSTGTGKLGKIFGPVMLVWFSFIGIMGLLAINGDWQILKALDPSYAYFLIRHYPGGFWLLGGIFLCTTGAEALYSDMGHVGRNNIKWSWGFIKICLVINYAGQTAWLVSHAGQQVTSISPFYSIVPSGIYILTVIISTLATIIASQALITGCFTLVNEGIRLNIWPRHKVNFPGHVKGQLYIPVINWFLMIACIGMVLYFRKSTNMEAAFGLSVTLTMLVTSLLVICWLIIKRVARIWIILFAIVFLTIEGTFLIANLNKIHHGGWITLVIGSLLSTIMLVWYQGRLIQKKFITKTSLLPYVPVLIKLSRDKDIKKFATHLVYLSNGENENQIEQKSINSILGFPPKKADVYWFVHIDVTDEPYTLEYRLKTLAANDIYHLTFIIGFRIEPKIDLLFRTVVNELMNTGELNLDESPDFKYILDKHGDHKFVLGDSYLSHDNDLPGWKKMMLEFYYNLKKVAVKEEENFGLDMSNVLVERYPLVITNMKNINLKRQA